MDINLIPCIIIVVKLIFLKQEGRVWSDSYTSADNNEPFHSIKDGEFLK
jgi:hypothetical protein